jgi:hypothetical protein
MRLVFSLEVDQYNSMQAFFNFNPEVVATDSFSFPSAEAKMSGYNICLFNQKKKSIQDDAGISNLDPQFK